MAVAARTVMAHGLRALARGRSGVNTEAFRSHVQVGDGCWPWTGRRDPAGYGRVKVYAGMRDGIRGRVPYKIDLRAHRVAWESAYGPIPDGLFVCHHCDNPPCVRPEHLFLGTAADNAQDASRKGRLHGSPGPRPGAGPSIRAYWSSPRAEAHRQVLSRAMRRLRTAQLRAREAS